MGEGNQGSRGSLVRWTARLADEIRAGLDQKSSRQQLAPLHDAIAAATDRAEELAATCRLVADSVACAIALLGKSTLLPHGPEFRRWLVEGSSPLWRPILDDAFSLLGDDGQQPGMLGPQLRESLRSWIVGQPPPGSAFEIEEGGEYFFEAYLRDRDADRRARHGVFFTPRPVTAYIVGQVDRFLMEEFGIPEGLASISPPDGKPRRGTPPTSRRIADRKLPAVRVLDPAAGSGIFLIEIIALVHRRWVERGVRSAAGTGDSWDEYVADRLLPGLCGIELLLPACVSASVCLAFALARTGFGFRRPARIPLHLANTLAGPHDLPLFRPQTAMEHAAHAARAAAWSEPFPIVVGNPPFSGISQQPGAWSDDLLRGRLAGVAGSADYYQLDGQPLRERKLWLQDDYVKFLRLAHGHVETAGAGIVGLVTNHGYLDNPTFRGVRWQLLRTFPRIRVIDLHGNRRKGERAAGDEPDENVFAVDQGTAIGWFRRPPGSSAGCVEHAEVWGERSSKLSQLGQLAGHSLSPQLAMSSLAPGPPLYLFVPQRGGSGREYERGRRLTEVMPAHVTAPVTARDHLVIGFTGRELRERIEGFCDLGIADEEIRRRFFPRVRTGRYAAGDTRGWKLGEARRRLAADPGWADQLRPCWYRPFDRREILWCPGMVDWPRDDTLAGPRDGRLALVARRQMLPAQPRNFFWVVDQLALDGLIRSDNRGSECLFPVVVPGRGSGSPWQDNFDAAWLAELSDRAGLAWDPRGRADPRRTFGPDDVLGYIYAQFFSPSYRERYAEPLGQDFPRVFAPSTTEIFLELARLGRGLIRDHLLQSREVNGERRAPTWAGDPRAAEIVRGYPQYREGRVWIDAERSLGPVSSAAWEFRAGAHQVCRKWLRDRCGRRLDAGDAAWYRRIVLAVERTLRRMQAIDRVIARRGGWSQAFR